jgi:ubiquinone/menaquinone biosynthesis C-methylase UbiE
MGSQVSSVSSDYLLGYSSAEHDRLIRQAARFAPTTERLFREAGIGPGQRVLDLGSGVGDVAMLVARLVGPTGEVVGIERDASSIAQARARAAAAGLRNISFRQTDVNQVVSDRSFDAGVGRFILMFLPDPVSVLHSVFRLIRPDGVMAFQEPSWIPFLALGRRLPLWFKALSAIHETLSRSGANPEMGLALYAAFQQVGLPAPSMHMEILLADDAECAQQAADVLRSVRRLAEQHNVSLDEVGDLETLADRLHAEVKASNTLANFVPIVSAWSRKPIDGSSV